MALLLELPPPLFLRAAPPPDVTVNLVILFKSPPTSAWRPNFGLTHGRYFTECAARLPVRVLHGLSVQFSYLSYRVLIKKRSARSIDGLTARKARKNNRRAAGLDAAAARLEGARPGSPEGGPG